ncbi:DNA topoisomerase 6 subunit A3 [Tanacetum coccineum]
MGDGENPANEKGVLSSNDDADKAVDFFEQLEKGLRDLGYSTQSLDEDLAFVAQKHKEPSVVPSDADKADDFSEELEKDLRDLGYSTQSLDEDLAFVAQRHKEPSVVPSDADKADDFSEELEKDLGDLGYSTQSLDADLAFVAHRLVGRYADDIIIEDMGKQLGDDWGNTTQVREMGCVIGGIGFVDRHLNVTDCTQFTVAKVPLDVDGISVTNFSAKFILLVEKIDLARRLRKSPFYSQFPCVIVAMGREPDYSTRKFLYMLNKGKGLKLQLFALLDCNPHSIKTMLDLIHYDQLDINWLGIQPCHVPELIKARVLAGHMIHEKYYDDECLNLLNLSLQRQHHRLYRGQLRFMSRKIPYKVPVEALSYNYLIDCYLPRQLRNCGLRVPVTK